MKRFLTSCIIILLTLAVFFCGYRYYDTEILTEKRLEDSEKKQLQLFEVIRPEISIPETGELQQKSEILSENPLAEAEEINHNTVGWITIPDTNIDYPVVQSEDNDFYLHNGFDGKYNNELGCPFLDYRCESDFSGFSSIVYAHNMEGGRMFADIALYKDKNFMQSHSEGYLILDDGIHMVDFFAYLTVPGNDTIYHTVFLTDSERQDYINYLLKSANYTIDSDINENKHLLLLSTCTFEYEEARGVLVGVIQ